MSKPISPKIPRTPSRIQELEQQVAEITDALMRERADATNIRRRHEEQITGLKSLVKVQIIEDLLPVIDNFERALKHVPKDLENNDYIKGVGGVVKQFEDTLKQMGVERIKTVGEHFDPNLHDAVGIEDGDGEVEVVCEELQPGYRLGENVIRHAMVKVKKEPK
jgi:molecular chaperone GrpE